MVKRYYPNQPVLAVGMCVFSGGRLLIVRRNKEPGKGKWTLPGGVVELGESLREALKREIMEELGIEVEPAGLLGIFERIENDKEGKVKFHYVILDYYGIANDVEICPSEEIAEYAWVEPSMAGDFIEDPKALSAIEKAAKEIKDLS